MKAEKRRSDESGEIMIESMIIVLMTTFVLIFMVSVGFLLYQKSIINTVANETAAEIAQTYKFTSVSDENLLSRQQMWNALTHVKKYRYLFAWGSLEADNTDKAQNYSVNRLEKTSFATEESSPTIELHTKETDKTGLIKNIKKKSLSFLLLSSDHLLRDLPIYSCPLKKFPVGPLRNNMIPRRMLLCNDHLPR